MLPRLRFDPLVSRNHQQHQINSAHAREHVAHKTLVPGDVDKAQPQGFAVWSRQIEVSEAKVNGDPASLLFFQSVSINSGQSLDQCSFTVIDVPCRAHDDGFHLAGYYRKLLHH